MQVRAEAAGEAKVASVVEKGLLRLTLSHPQHRNALGEQMLAELQAAIDDAEANEHIAAVIIAAAGPVFSSGHDLAEITAHRRDNDGGKKYFERLLASCSRLMQSIATLPKPVLAEVQGLASAAGCQLAASCDMIVAAESAAFCTPGVNIGLFCSTPMVALSRAVSAKHAMEMLLTGAPIPACEALRIGLVNRVVKDSELASATEALARQIMTRSLAAISLGKRAFHAQGRMALDHAYSLCSKVMVDNLLLADADEGIGAFLEKRAPHWPTR
ncbi:MAG: enoyl-CoA hydratase [Pseudomonadota bacterium]|nr:enoyl-CoA hydratase [Pseudomonadota bacterium]